MTIPKLHGIYFDTICPLHVWKGGSRVRWGFVLLLRQLPSASIILPVSHKNSKEANALRQEKDRLHYQCGDTVETDEVRVMLSENARQTERVIQEKGVVES
ncbi:hypothetical protein QCA50_016921 [Cerrena zonata]|uniref:Uncharacterized protein n=1 Tax=Cerrena zonata TaxID=2478898 RepID=A0AAW0FGI0_9APHY